MDEINSNPTANIIMSLNIFDIFIHGNRTSFNNMPKGVQNDDVLKSDDDNDENN